MQTIREVFYFLEYPANFGNKNSYAKFAAYRINRSPSFFFWQTEKIYQLFKYSIKKWFFKIWFTRYKNQKPKYFYFFYYILCNGFSLIINQKFSSVNRYFLSNKNLTIINFTVSCLPSPVSCLPSVTAYQITICPKVFLNSVDRLFTGTLKVICFKRWLSAKVRKLSLSVDQRH